MDLAEEMKTYISVCPTCSQCEPYSQLACIVATLSMGFKLDGIGNYGTKG